MGPKTRVLKTLKWNPGPGMQDRDAKPLIFYSSYPRFLIVYTSSFSLVSSLLIINYLKENAKFSSSYILK